jgi:hypothetical protein
MRRCNMWVLAAFGLLMAVTQAIAQEQAPEVVPGGIVVLRGSTPAMTASPLPPPGPSNPLTTGPATQPPPASSYGWDARGFDDRFDRSGLTPTPQ